MTTRTIALALLAGLLAVPLARAETRAQMRQQQLDYLYKALRAAPDENAAGMIERRIRSLWAEEPSPAAALLMTRADRELHNDAESAAIDDYSAVLDLEPTYAQAYTHRAVARAAVGDYTGAVSDIEAALSRDPRDFSALQALSRIAEQQGNWKGALDAWRKALDIDPRTPGGAERLRMLTQKVEGEAT